MIHVLGYGARASFRLRFRDKAHSWYGMQGCGAWYGIRYKSGCGGSYGNHGFCDLRLRVDDYGHRVEVVECWVCGYGCRRNGMRR